MKRVAEKPNSLLASPKLCASEHMVEESPQAMGYQFLCGQTIHEPEGKTIMDLYNQIQVNFQLALGRQITNRPCSQMKECALGQQIIGTMCEPHVPWRGEPG